MLLPESLPELQSRAIAAVSQAPNSKSAWSDAPLPRWLVLGVLSWIVILYVGICGTPVIFDDNEGLYADAVREMHARGDWLVPMSNGFPRVQKPPLVYWAMLVSTSIFGDDEFGLRLPNALASGVWIVLTFFIGRRVGSERLGLAAAAVLASMLGVWVFTHLVQPEPFLAAALSLAFWALLEARRAPRLAPGWVLLFWSGLALGTLSKGLHGALWPLGTVALLALLDRSTRPWLGKILSVRGLLLFLVLVVPWYAIMSARLPGFLAAHFLNEQLGATLNTRYPPDARQLPLAQFYLQHLLFWLPWTLGLPAAIAALLKWRAASKLWVEEAKPAVQLITVWLLLTLVSVAFSTRQDYYSLTAWGVVAIGLAAPWVYGRQLGVNRYYFVAPGLLLAVGGALALAGCAWAAPRLGQLGESTAAPIRERDTFLSAIQGISPALWGHFLVLATVFGLAMLVAGSVAAWLGARAHFGAALGVVAGATSVPIVLATIGFTIMSPYFSLANQARAIAREFRPGALVACEALPNTASSLLYYLPERVHWVNAPFDNQYAQQVLHEGRDFYWDEASLEAAWNGPRPVYLILDEVRLPYWQSRLGPHMGVLQQSGTRLVLSNRP